MSNIEISVASDVTADNFLESAASGKVKFYRVRGNGSTRHIPFLADGTPEREVAEYVMEQREEGVTMRAIAAELHLSVPSVRRMLNALLLAEEVEDYDREDLEEMLSEATNEQSPELEHPVPDEGTETETGIDVPDPEPTPDQELDEDLDLDE